MPSLAPSESPTVTLNSLLARFHDLPLQAALTSTCRCRVLSTCVPLTHQQGLHLQAYLQFIKGVYSDGSELPLQEGETCIAHPLDERNTVLILFWGSVSKDEVIAALQKRLLEHAAEIERLKQQVEQDCRFRVLVSRLEIGGYCAACRGTK